MEELNINNIKQQFTKKHGLFIEKAIHQNKEPAVNQKKDSSSNSYPQNDFRAICRKILGKEYKMLTITDKKRKKRPNEPFYVFTIEFNEFVYTIYDQDNRRVIKYDCKQEALFLNDKKGVGNRSKCERNI